MSREANRAKFPPELVAAIDEVRESCPDAKVRWLRTKEEQLGADPLDEPGTMWISADLYVAMNQLHAAQNAPRRGK